MPPAAWALRADMRVTPPLRSSGGMRTAVTGLLAAVAAVGRVLRRTLRGDATLRAAALPLTGGLG